MGWKDIVKTVVNPLGSLKEGFESITGQSAAESAIKKGNAAMQQATNAAVQEQQAAREQITQNLRPFRDLGVNNIFALGTTARTPVSMEGLPEAQLQSIGPLPSVMPGNIGQDSLFQSLKRQAISGIESSAAARGKLFSGSTPQAIAEQVQNLALGRAGQIQAMNMAARDQMIGERGQLFSQDLAARQALLGERVGEQERRYQQLFNLVGLGQASAAQQAANLQASAGNIGNLYTQQANAQAAALMGQANLKAQAFQGLLSGVGTGIGAYAALSDRRMKTNIKKVGTLDSGLPVYTFRYKGDSKVHMGVMAQDVEKVNPDAVTEINGIKHVYYGAL